jgi:phosphoglycolate phosphatase
MAFLPAPNAATQRLCSLRQQRWWALAAKTLLPGRANISRGKVSHAGVTSDERQNTGKRALYSMAVGKLRLVIFDCDGTLVDSQHTIVGCFQSAFEDVGLPVPEAEAIRRNVGLSVHEFIRRLVPEVSEDRIEQVREGYRVAYTAMRSHADFDEPLYPGLVETLDRLEDSGHLFGVATGKSLPGLKRTLDFHGLLKRFVTLQTADLNPGKPDPTMISQAIKETGVEPVDAVMIGDTSFDMEMARNAGVLAIGVSWGYHTSQDLYDAGARAVVDTFDELPSLLPALMGDTL